MARDSVASNHSVNITQVKMGSVITGNMKSKHSIRVDGHVTGDLISEEKVIIGIHGEIGGNLHGADITIEGYVNGDVLTKGSLHVASKAVVLGRIFSKEISIEKGAELNGQVNVGVAVEIPELDAQAPPKEKTIKKIEPVKPAEQKQQKASGDNYGTVAW